MPKPRRVAVMLDLDWVYKRHIDIFVGLQRYAQEQGWDSIIDEFVDDTLPVRPTKSVPYDGVIARATMKLARRAARLNVPVVNVLLSSPVWRELPGVFPDFPLIGRLKAEHLLSRGFSRFAVLAEEQRAAVLEMKAFVHAIENSGHSCIVGKLPLAPSLSMRWLETTHVIAASMADWKPPIGVYVGNEQWGRLVAQLCAHRGWRVPEDVAIIAGHNEELFCKHLRPTLTSVEVGYERIGYEAARLLDRLMHGEAPPAEPIWLPPQGLVVRESTDFSAVDDPLIAAALQFIAAKSHLAIGATDVAGAVNTELRTLQRSFRKYLDRPISAVIRRVRVERAKRELARSKRSLKEIARDVGFGTAMRMYEVFRRQLGITPGQYRRQRQTARATSLVP